MGSAVLQVLRQGVWASLTGGWYVEPRLGAFGNCLHLYAWIFLLALPLGLYTALPPSPRVGVLYCSLVGVFFTAVKALNYRLHSLLDRPLSVDPELGGEGGVATLLNPPAAAEEGNRPPCLSRWGLELSVLGGPGTTTRHPSLCGFNQLSELLPDLEDSGAPRAAAAEEEDEVGVPLSSPTARPILPCQADSPPGAEGGAWGGCSHSPSSSCSSSFSSSSFSFSDSLPIEKGGPAP